MMNECLRLALAALLCVSSLNATASVRDDLHALFEREWERGLRENPEQASFNGDRRYNREWTAVSLEAVERRHAGDRAALTALRALDRNALSVEDQLNYDLFERELLLAIDAHAFRGFLIPLNQRGGVQSADEILQALRFEDARDYEDWLARLNALPALIDEHIELMRSGIREGRVPPRIIMSRIPAQIEKQLVARAEDSPFYAPFTQKSAPRGLALRARKAIEGSVIPAYRRFLQFFNDEYLPACRDSVGAWDQPDGAAAYAFAARAYTTTALTPDQIHAIGLKEVARIRAEMNRIIRSTGFKGSFADFLKFLRTDPRFFHTSGEALFNDYLVLSKKIDPTLPALFRLMPRMPYGLRAIPDSIAPDTTTAYYYPPAADGSRAGYYYVNLYQPESRPKWEMEALSLHEAVPGHHFQIALQMELEGLPQFRQQSRVTAYIEGWALYAESLGDELGFYTDPYSKFGQLTYEMWRAVRLVVDTGLHHKRWSREQAIAFFRENAPKAELDIVNEIDRYIAWPGQALAYKIGELRIKALRQRAEQKLGERFDIRDFHDVILSGGALPLDILEQRVEAYIQKTASRAP